MRIRPRKNGRSIMKLRPETAFQPSRNPSMLIKIETNIEELGKSIEAYIKVSGKSLEVALKKHGAELSFRLKKELLALAPAKGSIRSQVLSVLAGGTWASGKRGVRVRESVLAKVFQQRGARSSLASRSIGFGKRGRGTTSKGLNIWALAVQAEINLRESARKFLGASAIYPGIRSEFDSKAKSRVGPLLSVASYKSSDGGAIVEFNWGGFSELSTEAAEGITTPKGEAALERALQGTIENIEVYLKDKLGENWNG